jgi:hypothetical protein
MQVDPDALAPKLPILRNFLHHLVYDLQPSCVVTQTPKTQAPYMILTPLSIAPHRYVSLVYRQPKDYTPPPLNLVEAVTRGPFDVDAYVEKASLVLVGGNFMMEGLSTTTCALVPGCTADGSGYAVVRDGSALDGVAESVKGLLGRK